MCSWQGVQREGGGGWVMDRWEVRLPPVSLGPCSSHTRLLRIIEAKPFLQIQTFFHCVCGTACGSMLKEKLCISEWICSVTSGVFIMTVGHSILTYTFWTQRGTFPKVWFLGIRALLMGICEHIYYISSSLKEKNGISAVYLFLAQGYLPKSPHQEQVYKM